MPNTVIVIFSVGSFSKCCLDIRSKGDFGDNCYSGINRISISHHQNFYKQSILAKMLNNLYVKFDLCSSYLHNRLGIGHSFCQL